MRRGAPRINENRTRMHTDFHGFFFLSVFIRENPCPIHVGGGDRIQPINIQPPRTKFILANTYFSIAKARLLTN
jgi:hypothetical protein